MPATLPALSDFSLTPHARRTDYLRCFTQLLQPILERVFQQLGHPVKVSLADNGQLAEALWQVADNNGWPRPLLQPSEMGNPGKLDEQQLLQLSQQVHLAWPASWPTEPAGIVIPQLIKTLLLPEFRACRQSFHDVDAETNTCRRQQLDNCRSRMSGSHCVDCPYFIALSSAKHLKFLRSWWEHGDPSELETHRETFLPEDFRILRRFLYVYLRHGCSY